MKCLYSVQHCFQYVSIRRNATSLIANDHTIWKKAIKTCSEFKREKKTLNTHPDCFVVIFMLIHRCCWCEKKRIIIQRKDENVSASYFLMIFWNGIWHVADTWFLVSPKSIRLGKCESKKLSQTLTRNQLELWAAISWGNSPVMQLMRNIDIWQQRRAN